MSSNPYRSYLEHYAEPIASDSNLKELLPRHYQFVLVIPIYDEPLDCLEQVLPNDLQDALIIVVVNAAEAAEPVQSAYLSALHRTRDFLQQFQPHDAPLTVVPRPHQSALLIVDCCSEGRQLPRKQGVGLARKIGGDLAVACIDQKLVASPWIHCTDADVELPLKYFGDAEPGSAVAIYPFRHSPLHRNILQYEISLRYYVLQLAASTSPYAFQTIGSLLKINARNYVAVRGFPKRQAAEDFYMLNKLAKTGRVERLTTPIVSLSSRVSRRVPFGTGAAIGRLANEPDLQLYHPEIFEQLHIWLGLVESLWCDRSLIAKQGLKTWWPADVFLLKILQSMGLGKMLQQSYRQCHDWCHFQFFLWVWFDAFRTLKFVHALRDQRYASLPIDAAIAQLPGMAELTNLKEASEDSTLMLQTINDRLILQEQQLPKQIGPTAKFKSAARGQA